MALIALAFVAASFPFTRGDLTTGRTFLSIPGYWLDTADFLETAPLRGRALIVPGSSFGTYLWGQSHDEPLQVEARTPWAVRDAVPLSSAGNIRGLDEVEALFSDGRGEPGLAVYLARMGVSYLVVRNDLDYRAAASPRPSLVHQALRQSGHLTRVAAFGPLLSGFVTENRLVDGGVDGTFPAVEVYRVEPTAPDPRVVLRDLDSADLLEGETESLLGLSSLPGAQARTTVREADTVPEATVSHRVVTDSGRRVEVDFGRVHDNRSSTLFPDQPWSLSRRVHDYVVAPAQPGPTASLPVGEAVSASSSAGDASSPRLDPARGPWNAVDGDPATSWAPGSASSAASWWQVQVAKPLSLDGTVVRLGTSPDRTGLATVVRVTTDRGSRDLQARLDGGPVVVPADLGPTSRLRLTFGSPLSVTGAVPTIAEVVWPGVSVSRTLTSARPSPTASTVSGTSLSLAARHGARGACVVGLPTVCVPSLQRAGEEQSGIDRTVDTPGLVGSPVLTVTPRPSSALNALLGPAEGAASATASSTWLPNAPVRPQAAIDGDPATGWVASPADPRPTLSVVLARRTTVSWLRFQETSGAASSRPISVVVGVGERQYRAVVDDSGYVSFPATSTTDVSVQVLASESVLNFDSRTGEQSVLPVGISELILGEADEQRVRRSPDSAVDAPCGSGPTIVVDGSTRVRTRVSSTYGNLVDGDPMRAVVCGGSDQVRLAAGSRRIVVRPSAAFDAAGLTWTSPRPSISVVPPTISSWSAARRFVELAPSPRARTLELAENFNAGWTATIDGQVLQPLRVDGWRQAWVVPPATSGTAELVFAPDTSYRRALAVGGAAALVLLALVLTPARRHPTAARRARRPVRIVLRVTIAAGTGLLALGLAGGLSAALATVLLAGSDARRRWWVAAAGVLAATTSAVLAPWPAGTTWPSSVQTLTAVVISAASGLVVGCLFAPRGPIGRARVRTGEPSAEPVVPPAGT
jgi:arabinofuranan 3-O-arabinosyltransferase